MQRVADHGAAGHGIWQAFGLPGNRMQYVGFAPNLLIKRGA